MRFEWSWGQDLVGWGGGNPFGTDHLSLVQSGSRANFNGFAPDGGMDSGQTIVGTEEADTLTKNPKR